MRRSIATVSLSGTLNEKLTAVANAGFDGVEIFDQDLLCSLWTPRRIRERCDELGLKIEMLQPFRDLEGMTEAQHARAMRRFEGKLDIMAELGTDLVLVCASCQPDAIDDDELSAEQLHKAAELAHERGMRIAFEALAWSTHIWDYRRAWKIVRMADHPALGTCQDTFHVLSRRLDPWAIRDIPGEKIFFVQLSDAPEMAMDILQWSRHYRVWPGQGSWDVAGFLENCLIAGYTGPLSLEIFNTVFRRSDAERNARDALRSLLYVEDAVAHRGSMPPGSLDSAPPAPRVTGLEFVELAVLEQHPLTAAALTALGFRHTGNNREKPIELWEQGYAKILLNTSPVGRGGQVGPHIAALAVGTPDPVGAFERGAYLHATVAAPGRGPKDAADTAIEAPDGTAIFFSRLAEHPERWAVHYDRVSGESDEQNDLDLRIDHVSLAQPFDNFEEAALFFKSALGLQTHEDIEIPATYGLFRSRAVSNQRPIGARHHDRRPARRRGRCHRRRVAQELRRLRGARHLRGVRAGVGPWRRAAAHRSQLLRRPGDSHGLRRRDPRADGTPRHPVRPDRVGEAAAGLHADDRQPPLLRAVPTDRRIRLVRHRKRAGADLGPPGCDPRPTHQGRRRGLALDRLRRHMVVLDISCFLATRCRVRHRSPSRMTVPHAEWQPTQSLVVIGGPRCRDAAKIDKKRRATLTKVRRVARACQTSLHNPRSRWTGHPGRRRDHEREPLSVRRLCSSVQN